MCREFQFISLICIYFLRLPYANVRIKEASRKRERFFSFLSSSLSLYANVFKSKHTLMALVILRAMRTYKCNEVFFDIQYSTEFRQSYFLNDRSNFFKPVPWNENQIWIDWKNKKNPNKVWKTATFLNSSFFAIKNILELLMNPQTIFEILKYHNIQWSSNSLHYFGSKLVFFSLSLSLHFSIDFTHSSRKESLKHHKMCFFNEIAQKNLLRKL